MCRRAAAAVRNTGRVSRVLPGSTATHSPGARRTTGTPLCLPSPGRDGAPNG